MRLKLAVTSLFALMLVETDAQAYLDPGTGSMILQAMIATVASSLFVVKMYWYKLRSLVGLAPSPTPSEEESESHK